MVLEQADPKSDKLISCPIPYFYLLDRSGDGAEANWAVFLGNDFKNMSQTLNRPAYIKQTNLCLDYIRRECRGCKLFYKPHPNETDEYSHFNLDGFDVIDEAHNELAEIYFWQNLNRIKYV